MVFLAYEAWAILSTLVSIFGNSWMPGLISFSLFMTTAVCFVVIITMSVKASPKQDPSVVFVDFVNASGWSDGLAAVTGLINPAFGFAAVDATIHYSEEVRDPEKNIPKAMWGEDRRMAWV